MKFIQVMNALDYGDGVSNDVINKYHLLKELGYETEIYSKWCHDKMLTYYNSIDKLNTKKEDIILHHFSGESYVLDKILSCTCKKVLVYHNITPPVFFNNKDIHKDKGELQLEQIKDEYDFFVGVSKFNAQCLRMYGINKPITVMHLLIDFNRVNACDYRGIKDNQNQVVISFIGRIAPNKKHEDIINIFEEYFTTINCNSKLMLVGNNTECSDYFIKLKEQLSKLNCRDAVFFTGKVEDSEVYNYYKNTDIFLCMSEHEGFCMPLLESMSVGIPTIAYDACAVPFTMGNAGVLVQEKDYKKISQLIYLILNNQDFKKEIVEKQYDRLTDFSRENIKKIFELLIKEWIKG